MSNNYYTPPETPTLRGDLSSQQIKDSFASLANAFDLLPPPIGGGQQGFVGGQFNDIQVYGATVLYSTLGSNASPCWGTMDYIAFRKNSLATAGAGNRLLMRDIAGSLKVFDAAETIFQIDEVFNTIAAVAATARVAGSTDGFLYIPTSAATSAGVPSKIHTGAVPLVYNSNTHKLGVYSGAWRFTAALT